MEPLPEVRASLDRLSLLVDEGMDLGAYLTAVSRVAEAMVPSCVGASITVIVDGEPYTMTATTPDAVAVDAVQNLDGGPCHQAMETGRPVQVDDVLDEERWQLFGAASGARGIRSSFSFPIRDVRDMIAGGINLYSSDPSAFVPERQRQIEVAFSADLSEAVSNADLSFRTREWARDLPELLDQRERVEQAVGVLQQLHGSSADVARASITRAASLAGVSTAEVADIVVSLASSNQ